MDLHEITETRLIKHYITQLYSELFGDKSVPSEACFEKIFEQLSANTHFAYEVKQHNQVVAFFTLGQSFSIFAQGRYGIINELWVNPECRAKGVGQAVMQEIIKLAQVHGWSRIDVTAPPDEKWNRTFEFYQKCGFEFTGRKLKLYPAKHA
ncbi:GNAT family N-acetyltransferase [Catenovulum sp. SM1970]|uniref:GNAT family N-acetyltransferase n=1 Tax=Marinifaba aquimaris TaxID=2741323 RepID=UPI001572978E|nr:GNAT family N-acetyltransferase [Marinifaba aquimaris]NTS77526.1 GNAT family N-acetyltransferase [Marinifaba aquimaris]